MNNRVNQWNKIANRSSKMLSNLTSTIRNQKEEIDALGFYQTYSKAALHKLPKLSKAIVDKNVAEMEANGYVFTKKKAGISEKYAMSIEQIIDIYEFRKEPKYRDRYKGVPAWVVMIGNLKGGVSKTVSTVTLAHSLRTHPALLKEDLRILVIDLDPQSSATMFLNNEKSIGDVENTAAQAMLQNVSAQDLKEDFILESNVPGVDIIPSSIEDAFIAAQWNDLTAEYLPGQNVNSILKQNLIDKIALDYDFIFVDSGPHLDALLQNSIAAADILMTPIPPAQVDFHSTLKYLTRLPELIGLVQKSGSQINIKANIGFMSKLANKADHKICHSFAKEIFGGDMLDVSLPRLDAFERCGESFDTVISANPANYVGSIEALKSAKSAADNFGKSVFDRIEFIKNDKV
ncbi:MAG: AAA family ATPase [Colwellia sp.]